MPDTSSTPNLSTGGVLTLIRIVLRRLVLVSTATAVLAVAVGYLVAGLPGVWAALIGTALSAAFIGATAGSLYLVAGRSPELLQIVMLGGWLVKMVLVVILMVWLQGQTFYHRGVLFATVVVVVIAGLAVETVTVVRTRIPYVQPAAAKPVEENEPQLADPEGDIGHGPSQDRHDGPPDPVG